MALIGRIFVILFALMLASLAAGIVIATAILGPNWHGFTGDFAERGFFWMLVMFASGLTWATGFLPLVIAIAVAESLKVRSLLAYAVAGALMMAAGYYATGF